MLKKRHILIISIIIASFVTVPVFAQEELSEYNEGFGTIIFTISASVIGSFIGGTLLGNFISKHNEGKRQKNELENIQLLLKSDFATFRRMLVSDLKHRKKSLEYFRDGKELDDENKDWDILQIKNPLSTQRYFLFWTSLEKSGSLIKLKPIDLKTIQIVMDALKEADKEFKENFTKFSNTFQEKDTDKSISAYLNYNENCYYIIRKMLLIIKIMDDIDWFDFDSEIKPLKKDKKDKKDLDIPKELNQDWSDLKKKYHSGTLMSGFLDEMELIRKEIAKTKNSS